MKYRGQRTTCIDHGEDAFNSARCAADDDDRSVCVVAHFVDDLVESSRSEDLIRVFCHHVTYAQIRTEIRRETKISFGDDADELRVVDNWKMVDSVRGHQLPC